MNLKKIQDVEKELKGKRILLRADFNVPIKESGVIMSDFRIRAVLPTIKLLQESGARIILISHIGRNPEESLKPVAMYLNQNLGLQTKFIPTIFGEEVEETVQNMKEGEIVMLENLRSDPGEIGASSTFTAMLAEYAEVYVNDAFSVSHRAHASIVGLPTLLPAYAGLRLQQEVEELSLAGKKHPILAVLGGAKLETKEPLIRRFVDDVDEIYVCGVLAHDFFLAKGFEIGNSLHGTPAPKELIEEKKIHIPEDVFVQNGARVENKRVDSVAKNDTIVDLGKESLEELKKLSEKSKTIIWNGPFGWYEKGFDTATVEYLEFLSHQNSHVIIGGGDTVDLVEKLGLVNSFGFVSTGGGAMLEFLEKGTLVGVEVLKK